MYFSVFFSILLGCFIITSAQNSTKLNQVSQNSTELPPITKSGIKCLDKVNGEDVRGFKGMVLLPWLELKCVDKNVKYCNQIFNEKDRQYCETVCCGMEPTKGSQTTKAPTMTTELPMILTKTTEATRKQIKYPKPMQLPKIPVNRDRHCENASKSNDSMFFAVVFVLLIALALCGYFLLRYKKRIWKLERQVKPSSSSSKFYV